MIAVVTTDSQRLVIGRTDLPSGMSLNGIIRALDVTPADVVVGGISMSADDWDYGVNEGCPVEIRIL